MSANSKTSNIGLNQWQGNEYPLRADFNEDNTILDTQITDLDTRVNSLESVTDQDLLKSVKNVDGSGSGLDSDLLDGKDSEHHLNTDNHVDGISNKVFSSNDKSKLAGIEEGATIDQTGAEIAALYEALSDVNRFSNALLSKLNSIETGAKGDQSAIEILELLKSVDGTGSGLDADLLDGLSSSSFLRSDATDVKTSGNLRFNDNIACSFGTNDDFHILHNNVDAYLKSYKHGGRVLIQGENASGSNKPLIYADPDNAVEIYNAGIKRFETKSDGINVIGDIYNDGQKQANVRVNNGQLEYYNGGWKQVGVIASIDKIVVGESVTTSDSYSTAHSYNGSGILTSLGQFISNINRNPKGYIKLVIDGVTVFDGQAASGCNGSDERYSDSIRILCTPVIFNSNITIYHRNDNGYGDYLNEVMTVWNYIKD